jgi:hypothetical protein
LAFFGAIPVALNPLTMTLAKIRKNAEQTPGKSAQESPEKTENLFFSTS